MLSFTARSPGLRRLSLDHRGFAVVCPLAPLGVASYPVFVRRPAASLRASFPRSVALPQLRFASMRVSRIVITHDPACSRNKRSRWPFCVITMN